MRETCISHKPKQVMAVIRQDYYELTQDAVSAALLNLFEYLANGTISMQPELTDVPVGEISIPEIQKFLLGLSTDKQIRKRLSYISEQGFISISRKKGRSPSFVFHSSLTQARLNDPGQMTAPYPGQMTALPRSNDRTTPVKQPDLPRSNDHLSIYKKYLKEEERRSEERALKGETESKPVPIEVLSAEPDQQLRLLGSEQSVIPDQQNEELEDSGDEQKGKSSGGLTKEIANELGAYYNSVKPDLWSPFRPISKFSKDKKRLIGYLWDFAGGSIVQAKQVISEGMAYAKCDPFYSGVAPGSKGTRLNRPGFSFFLENSRYDIWPEKCPSDPQKIHACKLSDAELQRVYSQYQQQQQKQVDPKAAAYERYKAARAAREAQRQELRAC